jgi:hypothetical protein
MNRDETSFNLGRILTKAIVIERSLPLAPDGGVTRSRICICCGEPMIERGNALSRDFNVCASCSSLADGMEEESQPNAPEMHA